MFSDFSAVLSDKWSSFLLFAVTGNMTKHREPWQCEFKYKQGSLTHFTQVDIGLYEYSQATDLFQSQREGR